MIVRALSTARGSATPIAVVSIGAFGLLAMQPVCDPGSLLDSGTSGGTVIQNQTGRELTPEEIAQIEANASDTGVVVVLVNPAAPNQGPQGPQGPPGPPGPPGLIYDEKNILSVSLHALVGEVRMWMGPASQIPAGWVACDGRGMRKVDFPRLYNLLGDRFTPANFPPENFGMPDLRKRGPRGADAEDGAGRPAVVEGGNAAFVGGAADHILTVNEMPAHVHDITHSHTVSAGTGSVGSMILTSGTLGFPQTFAVNTHVGNSGATGSGQPFPVLDPFFSVHYIMFTGEVIGPPPQ